MGRRAFGLGFGVVVLTLLAVPALTNGLPTARAAPEPATPAPASATPTLSAVGAGTSDRAQDCGRTGDAFGPVQSVRVAETSAAAQGLDWEPYTAQRAWPPGRTAVVDLRDAAEHEIETRADDPTGAPSQAP